MDECICGHLKVRHASGSEQCRASECNCDTFIRSKPEQAEMPKPLVGAWDLVDAIVQGDEKSRFIAAELQQWREWGATKGVKK